MVLQEKSRRDKKKEEEAIMAAAPMIQVSNWADCDDEDEDFVGAAMDTAKEEQRAQWGDDDEDDGESCANPIGFQRQHSISTFHSYVVILLWVCRSTSPRRP